MTAVVAQNGDPSRTYTFASQPRPVQQRKKFRDPLTQQLVSLFTINLNYNLEIIIIQYILIIN